MIDFFLILLYNFYTKKGEIYMGECADLFDSEEMSAIKRLARKRMAQEDFGPSTDCLDRVRFEGHVRDLIDEFIVMNGRAPKRSCWD